MSVRPQVGIERLPARRMSNEPRESMNCKSCRKRKIKCNRLRPTCEACQVFQCPCVYDAVPKKRGPKTDVLEALLKRVDGLERRLKDEKKSSSDSNEGGSAGDKESPNSDTKPKRPQLETANIPNESAVYSPTPISEPSPPAVQPDVLLDTYFSRCHGKAYYILDETSTRQRMQLNQIPSYLVFAIYAVSARYTAHPNGYHAAVRLSEDYAIRARTELDIDDPSVDCLQALLLLAVAFTAGGKGKKAHMMLASGIGMAMALELHREFDLKTRVTPVEKEMRRRLFWTSYLMDRFMACGSKRPSLIADKCILLRLPSWTPGPTALPVEGEFFQNGSNLQYHSGSGKKSQGSSGMLIDIVRILGITNRYLAAGGVKGDSHFPWHSLSNLSKIRQDLDIWASGTQDVFSSIDTLFGQPDSTTLVLSKLIYHLIHCLIYRPFLPIDLAELAGTGQHQSWQIEATNLCFLHANAIAELVELGKQSASIEWPAFVGYCICTAGTVHVHGTHYKGSREGEVFSASSDFLSREMQQLSELRYAWSSVQHQRDTLQTIYGCHSELVKSLASNPMRYSPVFQLEDFFDRYSDLGQFFDGAHISFSDIMPETLSHETYTGHDLYAPRGSNASLDFKNSAMNHNGNNVGSSGIVDPSHIASKRKQSSASRKKHIDLKLAHRNSHSGPNNPGHPENTLMSPNGALSDHNLGMLQQQQQQQHNMMDSQPPMTPFPNQNQAGNGNGNANGGMPALSQTPFSPPYSFATLGSQHQQHNQTDYDPMFGMPAMGFNYASSSNPLSMNNGMGGNGTGNGMVGGGQQEGMTPGARSVGEHSNGTAGTDEKDPFLSLLEQLAENENNMRGPSELDFFLSGGTV
ncbi:fungal-specific transcription factor domain-containing protein [Leptodontidium sp. 2 PMI_412]|nr:fungal-specific transcription factor domain-containing protein [Leptodontidium sp. MPI-SDFR-AT-0119]KAH9217744.1 fungal-specific transcription factor domain-containing protein [Leptodontidium sp. 2 PMI_412]